MDDNKCSEQKKITENNLGIDTKEYEEKRRLIITRPFTPKYTIFYGLIVFAVDSKRWLIQQQTHTVEFILFIKGTYRPTFLPIYLSCITKNEADIINNCLNANGGDEFFQEIYLKELGLELEGLVYARKRLQESHIIVEQLLPTLDLSDNKLDWIFPKGRPQFSIERESPLVSAQRQFVEDMDVKLPPALFISGDYILETIKTFNNRIIECKYWIYIVSEEFSIKSNNTKQWCDNNICRGLISNNTLFEQVAALVDSIQ